MMVKQVATICAMATLGFTTHALAAPEPQIFKQQLDSFVEEQMREQMVPGAAIAVLSKGEIVVAKGYGRATVEHDVQVTPETIFQSGSVGKMFTAVAVMTQVERGGIGLDDSILKYIPEGPKSWEPVTIRHLLTHTSGIPDHYTPEYDYRKDYTDDDLIKFAAALPLEFEPGARWNYSNTGYVLLGILLKKVTGKSYLEILDAEVFKPLEMKTAREVNDSDIVLNRAAGYELIDGNLRNQEWVSMVNPTADGALYLSLEDMITWAQAVEQGKVLTANSWSQVYTPVKLKSGKSYPYGFGWNITEAGGHPRYHHGGAWQGFRTYYSRYLGDDLSIVLLTNSANTKLDTIVDGIAELWDPTLVAPQPRPKAEPETEQRVVSLIELARSGTLRQQDLPLAGIHAAADANLYFPPMLKNLGPLKKLEMTTRQERGDDTLYTYTAGFDARTLTIELGLAPEGQVSRFQIDE